MNAIYMFISMLIGIYLGMNIAGFKSHHDDTDNSNTNYAMKDGATNWLLNEFRGGDTETRRSIALRRDLKSLKERAEGFEASLKASKELSSKYQTSLHKCQEHLEEERSSQQQMNEGGNSNREVATTRKQTEDGNTGVILKGGNPNNYNKHPICTNMLPRPTPSTSSLWNYYVNDILQASKLPNDRKYKFHDFTTQLLQIISPRLPRSVKSIPHTWENIEYVMNIGWKRYQYLQLNKQERQMQYADRGIKPPRPIKILVMGGSLLVGTNCRKLLTELHLQFTLPKRDCTWSNRLGQFLNIIMGAESMSDTSNIMFDVTKVAMGGTNTQTGSVILQYDLIPDNARNPDIVINAYATNDMHILTILEAKSQNITLRDKVFNMTQDFVRKVMAEPIPPPSTTHGTTAGSGCPTKRRPPPILFHIDDYLGNEQRTIWETTELSQGGQVLANYYGFITISYSDVIRDFVFGDTYESWFSANWWGLPSKHPKFDREIHPGMGMHISSTWVIVYNMLNLVTTYCSLPVPQSINITQYYDNENDIDTTDYSMGLPPLKDLDNVNQAFGKPKPRPTKSLPPILTQDLLIEDVTRLWRKDQHQQTHRRFGDGGGPDSLAIDVDGTRCKDIDDYDDEDDLKHTIKCPFSWISGLSLQQNNKTWIDEYFRTRASTWQGWILSDDGGKIGFIPTEGSSSNKKQIVLDFNHVTQPIQSVTFFTMKSYGTKWQNSRIKVQTYIQHSDANAAKKSSSTDSSWEPMNVREMVGFHDKNTSEMYTEAIELTEPIERGGSLRLDAQLIDGTTFKLMGLAVCS